MGFCATVGEILLLLFTVLAEPWKRLLRLFLLRPKKCVKGEVVLITGAGQGVGKQLALQFAQLDAIVVLWDLNQTTNESVAAEIRRSGRIAFAYQVDVTKEEEVAAAAHRVKTEVGDVTILINNAGVFSAQPLLQIPTQRIRLCFEVNAMAHFWILQQFLPRMLELDKGHIVSIASIAGRLGFPNSVDYCASKFAAVGLMESLYMELQSAKKGSIKLTTINPFMINTGFIPNVKIRFPIILPLLEVEETVKCMMSGILREEQSVYIPPRLGLFKRFFRCFMRRTRYKVFDFFQYEYWATEVVNEVPKLKLDV